MKLDTKKYVNKVTSPRGNDEAIKCIDSLFANMAKGDKVGTTQLVSLLRDEKVEGVPEKAATDLANAAARQTIAVKEGTVIPTKLGTEKYSRIVFIKQ